MNDGSYLTTLYRNESDRTKQRDGIVVRVLRYTHDDPKRVDCGKDHVLITTLLDEKQHPALELIELYHVRWEEELVFDEQKTHLHPPVAGKPTQLRSQTVAGVLQEVYALSLGHYVVRAMMAEAAKEKGIDPRRLSFVGCWRVLRCRLPECQQRSDLGRWWQRVLAEMGREVLPERRNRINPRKVKRRTKPWPTKKAGEKGVNTTPFLHHILLR